MAKKNKTKDLDTGWKYARTVHAQINPNTTKREKWENESWAVGHTNDKYASSQYTVSKVESKDKNGKKITKTVKNYPWTVTAHDFGLDIPENAYIKKVEFDVSIRVDKKDAKVDFPRVFFCIYGGGYSKHIDNTKDKETGWQNGLYMVNPKTNMTTTFTNRTYTMSESNVVKGKFTAKDFNAKGMGIDIVFDDMAEKTCQVHLRWVRIRVTYDVPHYKLKHNGTDTSKDKPRVIKTNHIYYLKFILQQVNKAKGGRQSFKLSLPFGVELTEPVTVNKGTFNSSTNVWSVNPDGGDECTLELRYKDYTANLNHIDLVGDVKKKYHWIQTEFGNTDDYVKGTLQVDKNTPPHHRESVCFITDIKLESTVDRVVNLSLHTNFNYDALGSTDNKLNVELDSTTQGVEFVSSDKDSIILRVAETDVVYPTKFRFCLRPTSGTNGDVYISGNGGETNHAKFSIYPPYEHHFGTKTNEVEDTEKSLMNNLLREEKTAFISHRVASELETGAYILPCKFKDGDAVMTINKPSIHMYKWNQIDYIGCVPVEHYHFDPKSTYKDKLLDTHYKNKRYMGKQLASDEDISLNIRLHPHQVTTIQGLIDMDKPIPINANHRCFEGDALNHRGWAEIYSISSTKTNEHWYKCDIDVKYLTHNLNTRFKIKKGSRTLNKTIPSLLADTVDSGDALSGEESSDYFIVDTDGTYGYVQDDSYIDDYVDDEGNTITWIGDETTYTVGDFEYKGEEILIYLESQGYEILTPEMNKVLQFTTQIDIQNKNMFTIDEGQHIRIRTKDPISPVSHFYLDWSSSKLNEDKENAISRIVRLINKEDNSSVFEYEYTDFQFDDIDIAYDDEAILTCQAIGRRKDKGDYITDINEEINLRTDIDDSEIEDEGMVDVDYFGSTIHFELNHNKLTVIDEGFNGNEIKVEDIELEGSEYYWEVEWINKNTDGDDSDITAYLDVGVQDTILSNKYSTDYSSMMISPFPVANKTILFTRNAEEGIIYYLQQDKQEFSYLIEPYYIYHNGVDLRTADGISIFNLNYGYKVVYLENGLVSLGINRLNGEMYLRKYDPTLKEYITLYNFQLSHYDDVNINSISDDKIELQASNTLISMYRGHPYVILKHRGEDISIINNFNRIWGEDVDGQASQYPAFYDLNNHDNMMPLWDKDDLDCWEEEVQGLTDVNIELDIDTNVTLGDALDLGINGLNSGRIHYLINGDEIGHAEALDRLPYDGFKAEGVYDVVAVYVGDDTHSYSVSPTVQVTVLEISREDPPTPTPTPTPTGKIRLTMKSPSKFTYLDNQKVTFTLTQGGTPLQGKVIEMVNFNNISTGETNSKGQCSFLNNRKSTNGGKYRIGGRYWGTNSGNKPIKTVHKDVEVKKRKTVLSRVYKAEQVNHNTQFKLEDDLGNRLTNQDITVYVNGKKHKFNTKKDGKIEFKVKKKGDYQFKLVYNGNKFYEGVTKTFKESNIK